jgi:lipopolysaccharide biosynthesis glycosyltransferase
MRRQALKSYSNFVRFILHKRLPLEVKSCLYLDVDTIIAGDIADWICSNTPKDKPLAAFPVNNTDSTIKSSTYTWLNKINFPNVEAIPHFVAVVMLINLDLWRRQNIDDKLLDIIQLNNEHNLYPFSGSQSPLVLVLGGSRFRKLDSRELLDGLGY